MRILSPVFYAECLDWRNEGAEKGGLQLSVSSYKSGVASLITSIYIFSDSYFLNENTCIIKLLFLLARLHIV